MDKDGTSKTDASPVSQRQLNKDIAFGIEQTIACLATDMVFDPYIGDKIQQKYGAGQSVKKLTWLGEVSGDAAALVTFIGLQRYFPGLARGIKNAVKHLAGGFYEKIGRAELKSWARRNDIGEDSPDFAQKVEEYKDIQANNFARSSIISVGSIFYNVATQKVARNPNSMKLILLSKLGGAAITMASVLGARLVFPRFFHKADEKLSNHISAPLTRAAQKIWGSHEKTGEDDPKDTAVGFSKKVEQARNATSPQREQNR